MALSCQPQGEHVAPGAGLADPEGRPALVWSSSRPVAERLQQEPSGRTARWHTVHWTKVAPLLKARRGGEVLWVLEPDPQEGPTPQSLSRTLQLGPSRPHTLVLLPESGVHDCALWLDAGADRCMPADSPAELMQAMVQALLRRCQGLAVSVSVLGPLRFDHVSRTLFHGERRVWLTCRETQVAALLFRNGMQRVHALEVLKALGAADGDSRNRALVSLYVHRLNRKIRPHGVQIDAVRGFGYSLRLITPGLRQSPVSRAWVNGLTQWLRASRPTPAVQPAIRP